MPTLEEHGSQPTGVGDIEVFSGSAAARPAPLSALRVGVVHENEMFAIGLRACLAEHFPVTVAPRPDSDVDIAVVSPAAAAAHRFTCPLVVCGDAPNRLAPGNVVLAVLPRATLTTTQLLASVHAAAAGLRVTAAEVPEAARLDRRSLDVLRLLAAGAGTREMAERLGYSERTIKSVIRDIQVLLGTRSRAQAVAEAIRQGLI